MARRARSMNAAYRTEMPTGKALDGFVLLTCVRGRAALDGVIGAEVGAAAVEDLTRKGAEGGGRDHRKHQEAEGEQPRERAQQPGHGSCLCRALRVVSARPPLGAVRGGAIGALAAAAAAAVATHAEERGRTAEGEG
eukprot:scaffold18046_cov63-Phaeocystis_antarctica.AAC.2